MTMRNDTEYADEIATEYLAEARALADQYELMQGTAPFVVLHALYLMAEKYADLAEFWNDMAGKLAAREMGQEEPWGDNDEQNWSV